MRGGVAPHWVVCLVYPLKHHPRDVDDSPIGGCCLLWFLSASHFYHTDFSCGVGGWVGGWVGWGFGLGRVLGLVCLGEVGGFSLCVAFLLHVKKKKTFVQHFVLHFF